MNEENTELKNIQDFGISQNREVRESNKKFEYEFEFILTELKIRKL